MSTYFCRVTCIDLCVWGFCIIQRNVKFAVSTSGLGINAWGHTNCINGPKGDSDWEIALDTMRAHVPFQKSGSTCSPLHVSDEQRSLRSFAHGAADASAR